MWLRCVQLLPVVHGSICAAVARCVLVPVAVCDRLVCVAVAGHVTSRASVLMVI